MNIITLTTDFGLDDWFVGTMKGVIAINGGNASRKLRLRIRSRLELR